MRSNAQMPFSWNTEYDLYMDYGFFGINTGQGNILGISSGGMENTWKHVVVVFPNGVPSPSNTQIYINGVAQTVEERRSNLTTASRIATAKIHFSGWIYSGGMFGGLLDDLRVYNYALSPSDVAALAEVLILARRHGEEPGSPTALEDYQRWRRFDATALALGMDGVNRLFSSDNPILRLGRDLGMGVVNALPSVRRGFMRQAAGLTGELPKLLTGRQV